MQTVWQQRYKLRLQRGVMGRQRLPRVQSSLAWRPRWSRRALDESPTDTALLWACWYMSRRSCNVVITVTPDNTPPAPGLLSTLWTCVGMKLPLSLSDLRASSSD